MIYDELLPIGSIVMVKNAKRPLMIFGLMQKRPGLTFDYVGVPYPEGQLSPKLNIGFNHVDVEEVIFEGYSDERREQFLLLIKTIHEKNEQKKAEEEKFE